jgi:polysaccharide export outer membrane protein
MTTGPRTWVLLVLLLASPAGLWAAGEAAYVIGPGDVLHVLVYDEPDLERTVTVQPDGVIRFPLVREVKVGGLSIREAEAEMERLLGGRFLVEPQVTIGVKEYHSKKVYVLGSVKTPGLYSLTGPTTVLEIISKAGGVADTGSRQILLVRGASQPPGEITKLLQEKGATGTEALQSAGIQPPIVIDGHKLFDEGDVSQNRQLQDGDIVYVPQLQRVYVLGEVRRPGMVAFQEGLTLVQAISLAGDVTEMASSTVYVTRKVNGDEKRIKVNFRDALIDPTKDLPLRPDDVINVKRRIL